MLSQNSQKDITQYLQSMKISQNKMKKYLGKGIDCKRYLTPETFD